MTLGERRVKITIPRRPGRLEPAGRRCQRLRRFRSPMQYDLVATSDELRKLLGCLLLVRHVANRLEACDAAEDGLAVRQRMQRLRCEVFGVRRGGVVVGTAYRDGLRAGPCGEQAVEVCEEQVIDGEASLLDLLRRLHDRRWCYVRREGRIEGFVSRSDLQRHAVRMLLFGLISLFEMQLLDMVQRRYDEQSLAQVLKSGRVAQARHLHTERGKRGEELHLTECLQIADKRDLLLATEDFVERFGFESKKAAHRFFSDVEALRDRLVHAQDLIGGSSWEDVTDTALRLAEFLENYQQGEQAR